MARSNKEHQRLAADYDRRWAHYIEVTTGETLKLLDPEAGHRIVDVGCGTGALLARLDGSGLDLTGVDPAGAMLSRARQRLSAEVDLVNASAARLPFPDDCFDHWVCSSAWHYFTEPRAALEEARRVLRSGGYLVLTDWCGSALQMRLLGMWLGLTGRDLHRVWALDALKMLLESHGFTVVEQRRFRVRPAWSMMTVRARSELPDRR